MSESHSLKTREKTLRRRAILEAAGSLFNEIGYHGTTIEAISLRTGMAKGSFYLHFQSKEEVFRSLLEEMGTGVITELEKALPRAKNTRRKLEAMARILLAFHLRSRRILMPAMTERGLDREKLLAGMVALYRRILSLAEDVIRRGMTEGLIVQEDPGRLAMLFMGGIKGIIDMIYLCADEIDPSEEAGWLVSRFMEGAGKGEKKV